ncbi:MAG: 50S ribosomal protein L28 [Planctomycetaceae bacterium]|nr:50S ribosomal protein L28 [Planctomycetota bacterium]NUN52792.1 50S ribosomal protein L28 [Planctomycetaceae bacterium]
MARTCDVCHKRTEVGNQITRRGLAKAKGGVGRKITGRSKRTFKPNVQRVKVMVGKTPVRKRVCVKCLKAGLVRKAV